MTGGAIIPQLGDELTAVSQGLDVTPVDPVGRKKPRPATRKPRDPVLRCPAILRTGNDMDYQCDLDAGHPGSHHTWRFLWGNDGLV